MGKKCHAVALLHANIENRLLTKMSCLIHSSTFQIESFQEQRDKDTFLGVQLNGNPWEKRAASGHH